MTMKTTTAVSMLLCAALAQSASAQCRVTELETQPGWQAVARSLTPKGLVVGALETSDRLMSRPATWTLGGQLTLVPHDPQNTQGGVSDATDSGVLIGFRRVSSNANVQAVRWAPQGPTPLSTAFISIAVAVNPRGVAVGQIVQADGITTEARRWTKAGVEEALPSLGGILSVAQGINRDGRMVGAATDSQSIINAVSWSPKGELRLLPSWGQGSFADRISDSGDVVGWAFRGETTPQMRPVLWRNETELVDLGSLEGGDGQAYDVNVQQVVVGMASTASGHGNAFVWRSGTMTNLNTMVPKRFLNAGNRLVGANRISDSGVILAWAVQSVSGQPDRLRSVILKRCLN